MFVFFFVQNKKLHAPLSVMFVKKLGNVVYLWMGVDKLKIRFKAAQFHAYCLGDKLSIHVHNTLIESL